MKEIKVSWLILSGFIGIVLGTIFANGMERLEPSGLAVFAIDQYSISAWVLQERKELSLYLFRQRGGQFLALLGIGFLCNSVFLAFLFTFFGGFIWGLILSLETMRLGIRGVLLAVACFFPQGICYLLAIWLFLVGKEQVRQQQYTPVKIIMKCILLPLVIMIVGVLLEIWVSPEFLQCILQ